MPDNNNSRRMTREEYAADLPSASPQERSDDSGSESPPDEKQSPGGSNDRDSDPDSADRGSPEGDFQPFESSDVEQANELFRSIHQAGYMTTGSYELKGDGDNKVVQLQVMLPSSSEIGSPESRDG